MCHRGCELFTVAFIATPKGGVPLVGQKHNPLNLMANIEDLGIPELMPNFGVQKATGSSSNWEKAVKEKQDLEKKIAKQIDSLGQTKVILHDVNKPHQDKVRKVQKVSGGNSKSPKTATRPLPKPLKRPAARNTISPRKNDRKDMNDKTDNLIKQGKGIEIKHKDHIHGISGIANGGDIITFEELFGDCEEDEELEKLIKESTAKMESSINMQNSKVFAHSVNNLKNAKHEVDKTEQGVNHVKTYTGETALDILSPVLHYQPKPKSIEVTSSLKKSGSATIKDKPLVSAYLQKQKQAHSHNMDSKTTVQPLPHPVQDHPVQANKQITTDSSDADERKTTTPKTSNTNVSQGSSSKHQITSVLQSVSSAVMKPKQIHPLLSISFLSKKPSFGFVSPPQISIIEIVKKKNNIDFEKLHQKHMKDAALCPQVNERLQQAKHSCRHG